ncbi:putative quinol monooxygenase [Pseudogulbenkiania sp. MAI-1]|uniref:putative quinol monooxygenase n=1 Tax=Pseudogulbenkiania sp. MAI-1 TaxID=990370 RepID=UPI00045E603D|nr:putative quinol monooxygenase [Pseudogulbenkiania sp. MAI-1]
MYLLHAELHAFPHTVERVRSCLERLVAAAKTEPGNIAYAVFSPFEAPDSFIVHEVYRDKAACDAHLASEPVMKVLQDFAEWLEAPPRILFCGLVASR